MEQKLYVIWDKVAEEAGPVFQAHNDAVAARSAVIGLKTAHNMADYELICVGEIDTVSLQGFILPEPRKVDFVVRQAPDKSVSVLEITTDHEGGRI